MSEHCPAFGSITTLSVRQRSGRLFHYPGGRPAGNQLLSGVNLPYSDKTTGPLIITYAETSHTLFEHSSFYEWD